MWMVIVGVLYTIFTITAWGNQANALNILMGLLSLFLFLALYEVGWYVLKKLMKGGKKKDE